VKAVIQTTLSGDFVNEYPSLAEAARLTNNDKTGISDCCRGALKSSGGYVWRFRNEEDRSTSSLAIAIDQYTFAAIFVKTYASALVAAKETAVLVVCKHLVVIYGEIQARHPQNHTVVIREQLGV
jgi:hypothetical protein